MTVRILISAVLVLISSFARAEISSREKFSIVMYSTVGGAVLGLSTLSFYGKPSDHVNNVYTGAALGLIGGISYVTYKTFVVDDQRPRTTYDFSFFPNERGEWNAIYAFSF